MVISLIKNIKLEEMINLIIYRALFPNGKSYIGKTTYDLEHRKIEHKANSNSKDSVFYRAIRKYGWDNIEWDIIDTAKNEEELNKKEIYWINYYNTYVRFKNHNGYNCTLGGDGISGFKHSKKSKKKISENKKGKYLGKENPLYGKHLLEETKIKISNSLKGKYLGENNYNAKITENEARKIKIMLSNGIKNISKKLNISKMIIYHIKRLDTWDFVLPELNDKLDINIIETVAKETKILLANGDRIIDIMKKLGVTRDFVCGIKYLKIWKYILPELNDILEKSIVSRTEEDIIKEIKIKLAHGEIPKNISKELNVTEKIVNDVKLLKTWRNILPELNNKIEENKKDMRKTITKDIAKEIKIRLFNGEKITNIANDLNVIESVIYHIKYLNTWKDLLPELNEQIQHYVLSMILEDTAKIIKIRLSNNEKAINIARDLNISEDIVYNIKSLRAWKHILPELNKKINQPSYNRISENVAKEIKIKLANKEKIKDIANEFNINKNTIKDIKRLRTWKWLLPELNNLF